MSDQLDPKVRHLIVAWMCDSAPDGRLLYQTNATFRASIDSSVDYVVPALVNGYALVAGEMEALRQRRIAEEEMLMRAPMMRLTEDQARELFGPTVFERVMREEGHGHRGSAGEAEGADT